MASPEFVRAAKREREAREKRDTWSVLFTAMSFGFLALTLGGLVLFKMILAKKVFWLFGFYGLFVIGEIVSAVGYSKARTRHRRTEEDLDVLCQSTNASSPQD